MSSTGRLSNHDAEPAPSPNFEPRAGGRRPDLVVLHYTAMRSAETALARLCDPSAKVSAHYLIGRDGRLWALVDEDARAWHAGVSMWGGEADVNSRSIGIELDYPGFGEGCGATENPGARPPFFEAQMARLEALLRRIMARWSIAPQGVLAHSDVAPGRKRDPGEKFDWARLARSGLAVALDPDASRRVETVAAGFDEAAFRGAARRFGYGDWPLEALLDGFRRRFRPMALARAPDGADLALMRELADRWPCAE